MAQSSNKKYLNLSQKNELLQLVGDNYSVLFDRKTDDVIKQNQWLLISIKLNAMGPMKTADGWKRCFTTLKAATKAKYVARLPLNDTELNISQMCHMNTLDVSREQSKKARKPRKAADSQREVERRTPSNQISAAPGESQVDHGNSSIQIANIPIEETGTYANTSQKQRLVRVIRYNYSALFGKISTQLGADSLKERIWTLLTWQLNTLGPKKDVKGWQTCFNYLKSKTKEKLTSIRQYKMRHGVSPAHIELSEIESEIIEMCNIDTLDGNSKVVELGLGDPYATGVRVRPNSTVLSSTVVSSMVPATISENACNESEESFEALSDDELMNVIPPTKSPIPSCQEVNAKKNLSKPLKILSVRSLRDVDESVDESYALNQAPTDEINCEELSYETLMADAAINELLFAAQGNIITTEAAREEASALDRQDINSMNDSQRPDDHENSQVDLDMEIRPLGEQRPQRRGVEINNHRYVQPNRQFNDEENNEARNEPRRNRLSVPLAVMAVESLELQRKQNALLGELVHLFRNFRNEH